VAGVRQAATVPTEEIGTWSVQHRDTPTAGDAVRHSGTNDATILASLLTELRLPSIARNWKRITEAANREGRPAQKTLATLLEIEVAERASRRIQRHRDQSETPVGKTFASFDFTAAPELSKPHLLALGAGGDWIKNGDNLLVFGESGTGKSHALAAICHALIDAGKRVLFTQTIDMVQRLQIARRDLSLVSALEKFDKYDLIVLDDISYVRKDQAETSVLFELIAQRPSIDWSITPPSSR
jgi:DNA replication protein DnaC